MADFDVIVVGHGIAGATLALHLQTAGQRVLVLDAVQPITASKIAAGLITPITGQRLTVSWRVNDFLPYARAFYTHIEKLTGRSFFHDRIAVRLFSKKEEQETFEKRLADLQFKMHLRQETVQDVLPDHIADTSGGGFTMNAAQLDVSAFLNATKELLRVEQSMVDWDKDLTFDLGAVRLIGHSARYVVSCEGFAATSNPFFGFVPFNAAKGDILTIRFEAPIPACTIHCGVWLAPTNDPYQFRVGSSYDWKHLNDAPDMAARAVLVKKLKSFCHVPFEVIDHQASVRPIVRESKALIGYHPQHSQIGFFNALGSKGSLHAPWFAHLFVDSLVCENPVPTGFDVRKYVKQEDAS